MAQGDDPDRRSRAGVDSKDWPRPALHPRAPRRYRTRSVERSYRFESSLQRGTAACKLAEAGVQCRHVEREDDVDPARDRARQIIARLERDPRARAFEPAEGRGMRAQRCCLVGERWVGAEVDRETARPAAESPKMARRIGQLVDARPDECAHDCSDDGEHERGNQAGTSTHGHTTAPANAAPALTGSSTSSDAHHGRVGSGPQISAGSAYAPAPETGSTAARTAARASSLSPSAVIRRSRARSGSGIGQASEARRIAPAVQGRRSRGPGAPTRRQGRGPTTFARQAAGRRLRPRMRGARRGSAPTPLHLVCVVPDRSTRRGQRAARTSARTPRWRAARRV